jgi:hypothetical protein
MSTALAMGYHGARSQQQEESIYNLIPTIAPTEAKPPRYRISHCRSEYLGHKDYLLD